ncbi:MAG: recombination regulator RecX [Anaerovibrio sp.]|uniref:regulatory protein RecX n=1 Tax=Anaerovibrio sp. TaxID=1872532 RepID=UPI0025E25A3B|nr:regulatory protein RecX [Anaerovibrio sp.]MCR5175305.1 recombination regulator RecX [Anaerovibrio sp.]
MTDKESARPARGKSSPRPSAKAKAVDLLSRSDQSVRLLSTKLARKQYSEEEIQEAVQWLQEKHYIDDEAGCRRRFDYLYNSSSYSVKQICAKLMQKGYDSSLVQDCVPDDIYEREFQKAIKVLTGKFKGNASFQKMMQYLYQKGFSYDAARNAVEHFMAEFSVEQ